MAIQRFEVRIPQDISLVLHQDGRGLHGLLCEMPDAADLIIAATDAIVKNGSVDKRDMSNQEKKEIEQIKDLAIKISSRYSGHPKI